MTKKELLESKAFHDAPMDAEIAYCAEETWDGGVYFQAISVGFNERKHRIVID